MSRLRLAFGWLMTAFAGHLDTRQVLLLWDRVIGYNTLTILPGEACYYISSLLIITKLSTVSSCLSVYCAVLAVSVFEFRATNLFKATSFTEAEVHIILKAFSD